MMASEFSTLIFMWSPTIPSPWSHGEHMAGIPKGCWTKHTAPSQSLHPLLQLVEQENQPPCQELVRSSRQEGSWGS